MKLVITNNAQSTLTSDVSNTATSITVTDGSLFPDITSEDDCWFPLTLISADGLVYEIVKATARDGNTIDVERGQENTPQFQSFSTGAYVSLRMTSQAYNSFLRQGDERVFFGAINLVEHVNDNTTPIQLESDTINEIKDGLTLTFRCAIESDGITSVSLNDSDPKPLRIPYERVERQVNTGELKADRLYEIQYEAASDRWILITPVYLALLAGEGTAGLVEVLTFGNEVFDLGDNPPTLSGAKPMTTRQAVSRIITDYHTRIPAGYLPTPWTSRGDGRDGVLNANTELDTNRTEQRTNVALAAGTFLTAGNGATSVLRVQGTFDFDGQLDVGLHYSRSPDTFEGPSGAYRDSTGLVNLRGSPEWVQTQSPISGVRDTTQMMSTPTTLYNAIMQGTPLNAFHGGHGFGRVSRAQFKDSSDGDAIKYYNDNFVPGRSGLIVVCKDCIIGENAKIDIPTVAYASPGLSENEIPRYTEGARPQKNSDPDETAITPELLHHDLSAGGGGMMIIVSETIDIHPFSQWRLDDVNVSREIFSNRAVPEGNEETFQGIYNYAAEGQLFHISTLDGTIRRFL